GPGCAAARRTARRARPARPRRSPDRTPRHLPGARQDGGPRDARPGRGGLLRGPGGAPARRPDRPGGEPGGPVAPPGRSVRHPVRAGPARAGGAHVRRPRLTPTVPALVCCALAAGLAVLPGCAKATKPVVIGAKKFTESVILAELGVHL